MLASEESNNCAYNLLSRRIRPFNFAFFSVSKPRKILETYIRAFSSLNLVVLSEDYKIEDNLLAFNCYKGRFLEANMW